jgi:hypothetical protein
MPRVADLAFDKKIGRKSPANNACLWPFPGSVPADLSTDNQSAATSESRGNIGHLALLLQCVAFLRLRSSVSRAKVGFPKRVRS